MIRRSDNALSLRSEIGAHANAKISLAIFRRMGVTLGRRHSLPSIRGKEKGSETRDSGRRKQEEEEEEEGGSPEEPRGARNETKEFRQVKGYSSGLFRAGRIETGGGEGFRKGFWEASIRE